jgi:hypothetical protein
MINPIRKNRSADMFRSSTMKRQKENKSFCKNFQANFVHLSINSQVMIIFTSLLLIFISFLIFLRINEVNELLNKITVNNYYKSVVQNIIDVERNIKVKLDEINYQQHINMLNANPLYYQLYLTELTKHNITKMEVKVINNKPTVIAAFDLTTVLDMNYYKNMNADYPDIDFDNKSKYLASAASLIKPGRNNLEFLVPMIYVNIPLLLQNMMFNGYYLENFYFMVNSFVNGTCDPTLPQQYAKYPLNKQESSLVTTGLARYFDTNIEPISKCGINQALGDKDKIKRNNWYYIYEDRFLQRNDTDRLSFERLLMIRRIQSVYKIDNYFLNFRTFLFDKTPHDNREYYVTVGHKFNRDKSGLPFLTNKQDEQPYEFIAIVNSRDYDTYVSKNVTDGLFYYDYYIDDSNRFLINTPTILTRLFEYTMLPAEVVEENKNGINPRSLLLTYETFQKIASQYVVNKNFSFDSKFFYLINFFNNFFKYTKYEQEGRSTSSRDFHKCEISNLTDYYFSINSYYDCLKDICFYKNCTDADPYYSLMAESRFIPNCHCLPLYCYDNYTITDGLPRNFTQAIGINFFDSIMFKDKKSIECRANFYFKDPFQKPFSFITKSWMKEADLFNDTDIFFLYMIEEATTTNQVIEKMTSGLDFVKNVVFTFFIIVVLVVTVVFNKCMFNKIDNFKERIYETRELHRLIIISSQSELDEGGRGATLSDACESEEAKQVLSSVGGKFFQVSDIEDDLALKNRYYDELQCIISIIKDNIDDFNIEFNINKNYHETNKMVKDFIMFAKKKYYIDKILPEVVAAEGTSSSKNSSFDESFDNSSSNISLNIIYELLSTEVIDFNDYKYNFYFKPAGETSMLNFYPMIETHLFNQQVYINELTDQDKVEVALQYYQHEIHNKWKDLYDKKLNKN